MSIVLLMIIVIKMQHLKSFNQNLHNCQISLTKLFEQIFGHKFETLPNKLTNTINKEKNQIIVNNIKENKKLYEERETSYGYDYVIQSSNQRTDLNNAINLILDFNETI